MAGLDQALCADPRNLKAQDNQEGRHVSAVNLSLRGRMTSHYGVELPCANAVPRIARLHPRHTALHLEATGGGPASELQHDAPYAVINSMALIYVDLLVRLRYHFAALLALSACVLCGHRTRAISFPAPASL